MKCRIIKVSVLLLGFFSLHGMGFAQTSGTLKPAAYTEPSPNLSITEYFVEVAPQYQTLMKILIASDINATIQGEGSFTLFAPNNASFTDLPYGNVDELLKPDNYDSLQKIVTFHILPGIYTIPILTKKIKENAGEFSIQTIGEAADLKFSLNGADVYVKDAHGNSTKLGAPVVCKNGLIYPLNTILMP